MGCFPILSQVPAANVFYITLLFIFLAAIVTAIATKWARDKCLKFFHGYHVTIERARGATTWGMLKVFSSGLEIMYDHPYIDHRGQKKTSFMVYQQELEQQLLSVLRYHDELDEPARQRRRRQIERTFNPGRPKRLWRKVRNFINTLRDAFSSALGAAVGQYQRTRPGGALTAQGTQVTQIGETLLGRIANAYEPLLEQYIGRPVILDVADPLNPNNAVVEYAGYLAEYTQHFIAIFNVEHDADQEQEIDLPDVEKGEVLPPLPPPPPPGAPPPALPPPLAEAHRLAIRIDGRRIRIHNTRREPVLAVRLEREGYEPVQFGMVIPANATLDLPARDARGGRLITRGVRCLDVVAPRKFATVRHAGELVERRGLLDELSVLERPRIPRIHKILGRGHATGSSARGGGRSAEG